MDSNLLDLQTTGVNSSFKNANSANQSMSTLKTILKNKLNSDMIDPSCPILSKKVHQTLKVSFKETVDVKYYFPECDDYPSHIGSSKPSKVRWKWKKIQSKRDRES